MTQRSAVPASRVSVQPTDPMTRTLLTVLFPSLSVREFGANSRAYVLLATPGSTCTRPRRAAAGCTGRWRYRRTGVRGTFAAGTDGWGWTPPPAGRRARRTCRPSALAASRCERGPGAPRAAGHGGQRPELERQQHRQVED